MLISKQMFQEEGHATKSLKTLLTTLNLIIILEKITKARTGNLIVKVLTEDGVTAAVGVTVGAKVEREIKNGKDMRMFIMLMK